MHNHFYYVTTVGFCVLIKMQEMRRFSFQITLIQYLHTNGKTGLFTNNETSKIKIVQIIHYHASDRYITKNVLSLQFLIFICEINSVCYGQIEPYQMGLHFK